jgi:glycosyltransferase involved in cell wall biosynthesis
MVCFLSHSRNADLFQRDPSFFYRCQNLAGALDRLELKTDCLHRTHAPKIGEADIFVFHRPRATWSWRLWIKRFAPSSSRLVVAEVDDLVSDPAMAAHSPAVRNRHKSLWSTRRLFRGNEMALSRFRRISTSTEPLAAHLRRQFPRAEIEVFPNCVPLSWQSLPMPPMSTESRALTYFPGTRGHNADFAMIAGAVQRFLASHAEWHLLVAGPLEFEIDVAPHRVRRLERVDFERYRDIVQRGAINLAPLEDSPFNRCKSALKIMEAGFFGIPTVASPIPDAMRFAGEGVEFAGSEREWLAALEKLSALHPYCMSWREELRQRIIRNASIEKEARRWLDWVGITAGLSKAEGECDCAV